MLPFKIFGESFCFSLDLEGHIEMVKGPGPAPGRMLPMWFKCREQSAELFCFKGDICINMTIVFVPAAVCSLLSFSIIMTNSCLQQFCFIAEAVVSMHSTSVSRFMTNFMVAEVVALAEAIVRGVIVNGVMA